MRTIAIALGSALFTLLCIAVWNGTNTPDCERMYNEYSNTTDMDLRAAIMHDGYENGCFHAE